MKLCINCKHRINAVELPKELEYSRCGFDRPFSLITGGLRPVNELTFCSTDRTLGGRCKLDAINYEPADPVITEEEELLKGNAHV